MTQRNAGLILPYHRIAELRSDPRLLMVTPHHFSQLEVLRDYGTPVSLREMREAARRLSASSRDCRHLRRWYADDADNVESGSALLARHGIPATFFVTTSYLGQE